MFKRFLALAGLLVAPFIFGCFPDPTLGRHPALQNAQLAPLIPMEALFYNRDVKSHYRLSPDGKKLAYLAAVGDWRVLHIKDLATDKVEKLGVEVYRFFWLPDSRHIVFSGSFDNDEVAHVYLLDSRFPFLGCEDLTPFEDGTMAIFESGIGKDPKHVLISTNERDPKAYDLYRLNIFTKEKTLLETNDNKVTDWVSNDSGVPIYRERNENDETAIERRDPGEKTWRRVFSQPRGRGLSLLHVTDGGKTFWVRSNRDTDLESLVRVDASTGRAELVYSAGGVDIGGVAFDQASGRPLFVQSDPDFPLVHFLDKDLEKDLAPFFERAPYRVEILSHDRASRLFVLKLHTSRRAEYWLFDRQDKKKTKLAGFAFNQDYERLARMEPVEIKARDGLLLRGYLSLPVGVSPKGLPMVLLVHGGPWARDYWGFDNVVQFLANRGYAVLQVNFRGSEGYGQKLFEAGMGEFGRAMQHDLTDAVGWAVARGLADPQKVAIVGASYGGYAALCGAAFTPDLFACAVDISGMSDIPTLFSEAPPQWLGFMGRWYNFVGNPANPDDLAEMKARSPLYKADQVKCPVLIIHGDEDPRVTITHAEKMERALKKAGKDVRFLRQKGEGHSLGKKDSRLKAFAEVELFLAKHLGGREWVDPPKSQWGWLEKLVEEAKKEESGLKPRER